MTASVCICTRNRPRLLRGALEHLARGREVRESWEIIVVDNGSDAAAAGIVEPFLDRLRIRLIHERRAGLSHARNAALDAASGEFLIFIDDDTAVSAEWLAAYMRAFQSPEAAFFGGPIIPSLPDESLAVQARVLKEIMPGALSWLEPDLAEGPIPPESDVIPWGANLAFRRSALGERRFDPKLGRKPFGVDSGEETIVIRSIRQAGGTGYWVPEARLLHYVGLDRFSRSYLAQYCRGIGWYEGRHAAQAGGKKPDERLFRARRAAYWRTPPWAPLVKRFAVLRDYELIKGYRLGYREGMQEKP